MAYANAGKMFSWILVLGCLFGILAMSCGGGGGGSGGNSGGPGDVSKPVSLFIRGPLFSVPVGYTWSFSLDATYSVNGKEVSYTVSELQNITWSSMTDGQMLHQRAQYNKNPNTGLSKISIP